MTSRWHTPQAATRTTTCPAPAVGSAQSSTSSRLPMSRMIAARIRASYAKKSAGFAAEGGINRKARAGYSAMSSRLRAGDVGVGDAADVDAAIEVLHAPHVALGDGEQHRRRG